MKSKEFINVYKKYKLKETNMSEKILNNTNLDFALELTSRNIVANEAFKKYSKKLKRRTKKIVLKILRHKDII